MFDVYIVESIRENNIYMSCSLNSLLCAVKTASKSEETMLKLTKRKNRAVLLFEHVSQSTNILSDLTANDFGRNWSAARSLFKELM